jgi:hypothetical protein
MAVQQDLDARLWAVTKTLQSAVQGLENANYEGSEGAWLQQYHDALPPPAAIERWPEAPGADRRWGFVLKWMALLQELAFCLRSIEREVAEAAAVAAPPQQQASSKRPAAPVAPRDLLSLRDYAAVHVALDLIVYWGVLPALEQGVGAYEAEQRPIAKAVRVHRRLLLWGVEDARHRGLMLQAAAHQLMQAVGAVQHTVLLDQFAPMLLPRFLTDILTGLLQVAYGFKTGMFCCFQQCTTHSNYSSITQITIEPCWYIHADKAAHNMFDLLMYTQT